MTMRVGLPRCKIDGQWFRRLLALVVLVVMLSGVRAWGQEPSDGESRAAEAGKGDGGERAITEEVVVAAPVGDVWRAWTTSEGIARFFAPQADIEMEVGGKYELYIAPASPEGQRGSEGCKVLAFWPEKMLSFSWSAPPRFEEVRKERTQVVLLFDSLAPDRTRVELTQRGWGAGAEWDEVYRYFSRAWPAVLKAMKAALEGGAGVAVETEKQWLIVLRPARETFMDDATEAEMKVVQSHYERLVRMRKAGTLILAGPSLDGTGPGLVIFTAKDIDAAREVMEDDPAVKAGVFTAALHPYRVSLLKD